MRNVKDDKTEELVPFSTRLPKGVLEDLQDLAHSRRRKLGRRVTVSELSAEAIRDLLKKYKNDR